MSPKPYSVLLHRAVITTADAVRAYGGNRRLAVQMLDYLRRQGQLVQIRRGLYIPGPSTNPSWQNDWDPYLVASRLRPQAALSFHSAFVVHGVAQNPSEGTVHVAASSRFAPFSFESIEFRPFAMDPRALKRSSQPLARSGEVIRVTRPEWTIAMSARLPSHGGGFEEIVRSSAGFRRVDMAELLAAAEAQKTAGIYNRLGFIAWLNRRRWRVQPEELAPLRKRLSASPVYFGVGPSGGLYLREWNLFIPRSGKDLLEGEDGAP